MLTAYRQHATGRKAIVFLPTVPLAHRMATVFREAGIRAEALDGKTPWEQRRAILARLHTGETRVVANVACWAKASTSLSRRGDHGHADALAGEIHPAIGRGLRTFPGKQDCLVIDVVGATERLDLQTLPRLFNLRDVPAPEVTVTEAFEREALERRRSSAAGRWSGRKPTSTPPRPARRKRPTASCAAGP